jgi:GntR family transcriptional regulator
VLEEQGHTMTRMREEVDARMPTPGEVEFLELPPGVPVFDLLHTSIDQNGEPYELTRFVMRSDLTGLAYDTPIE